MVAVPVLARDGDVIGVVVLHTEAPREFDDGVLNFLVHTASLAAGAIDNAKLYEGTRRRVEALTTLTQLSQALAAVTLREDLYDAVTRGARQLLGADSCQIWRIDPDADELSLAGADPPDEGRPGARRSCSSSCAATGPARWRMDCSWRRSPPATSSSACSFASPTAAGSARRTRSSSGGRAPERGGPEEGGTDRAAHGREHRQGHVRGARRRVHRGGRDEGRRGALRPHAPAPLPARRARRGARPGRPGRSSRGASRGACGASIRARSSTPATTASGWSPRSRRPPRPSSGSARPATSWPGTRASSWARATSTAAR